jgi:hypothetical protein
MDVPSVRNVPVMSVPVGQARLYVINPPNPTKSDEIKLTGHANDACEGHAHASVGAGAGPRPCALDTTDFGQVHAILVLQTENHGHTTTFESLPPR